MADTIIDGTEFNAQNTRYSQPKVNSQGGKSVNILNSQTKSGLRLSTPVMLTWGASDFVDEKTGKGNGKFEMSLQFPSEEYKNPETDAFLKNMIELETKIKADALTNSKDWFGKVHKNAEVVEALWTPMLKYSKNKSTGEPDMTKSPTLRIKLPTWEGVWKSEIYDEDGNALFPDIQRPNVTPVDFIQKGGQLSALIQCGGIWFANGKFGITWKLIQAVVQKPKETLSGKCFIKLKASEKARLQSAPAPPAETLVDEFDATEVADSDDEEDIKPTSEVVSETDVVVKDEEQDVSTPEPEPEPEPEVVEEPKKPVKKVVKKKVVGV
jgi:hypothetical protein